MERSYGGLAKRVEGVPTSTTNLDCVFDASLDPRCRVSMVRAIIRTAGFRAEPWAATCPLENRVKSDATNDKKIRFSFIRVIPLNLVISLRQKIGI